MIDLSKLKSNIFYRAAEKEYLRLNTLKNAKIVEMEEDVEKVLEAIEEEEKEGVWLLTVLGLLAGMFMVSVIATMLCHRLEPRPDAKPLTHDHSPGLKL